KAEAAVEVEVGLGAEVDGRLAENARRLFADGVQMLVGELSARLVEAFAPAAIGLVRERRAEHPVGDLRAVDGRDQIALERGLALLELAGQAADIPLAREAPELAGARAVC